MASKNLTVAGHMVGRSFKGDTVAVVVPTAESGLPKLRQPRVFFWSPELGELGPFTFKDASSGGWVEMAYSIDTAIDCFDMDDGQVKQIMGYIINQWKAMEQFKVVRAQCIAQGPQTNTQCC